MNLKREDIYKKLEQAFKDTKNRTDKDEIETSLAYHLNEEYDFNKFIKFYNQNIKVYQDIFKKEREKITKLITYVSLTKTSADEKIEKLPFLKTLDVFDNIKTIYFLYTDESKKKFEEIRTYFLMENIKIKSIPYKVDNESITSILTYLKDLAINGEINKEDTLIDSTLGLKITGIAMYKLAVEHGIKTVTWKDFQIHTYDKTEDGYKINDNKNGKRVPLLAELKLMEEPTNESLKIYKAINQEISKFHFDVVANYYQNMNIKDFNFFYSQLYNLINLGSILELNPKKFYDEDIIDFLNKIFNYNFTQKIVIEKIRDLIIKLVVLIDYKNKSIIDSQFTISEKDILDEKAKQVKYSLNTFELKEKLYYSLVTKYLFTNAELYLLNKKISNPIFQLIFNNKELDKELDLDNYLKILFDDNRDFDEIAEYLDFSTILRENEESFISLEGHTLYLKKFNIVIDLKNELNNIFKSNEDVYISAVPLVRLLKESDSFFSYDLRLLENKDWPPKKFSQYKTKLKNEVIFDLNNLVNKKLKEKNYKEMPLIYADIENTGVAKKYSSFLKIRINEEFFNYK